MLDVRRHVVGALERVGPVPRVLWHAASNQLAKSRRTSGLAFSFSVNDADVWRSSRCSMPISRSAIRGTAASTRA